MGTPKTMDEAIKNAIEHITDSDGLDKSSKVQVILNHVQDFAAQKFTPAMIKAAREERDDVKKLWKALFNELKKD